MSTLWGASYTFIRLGVATIPPVTLIAARTLIAGVLLVAWMAARGMPMPRDAGTWRRFAVQAMLNSAVPFTLIAWAEQLGSSRPGDDPERRLAGDGHAGNLAGHPPRMHRGAQAVRRDRRARGHLHDRRHQRAGRARATIVAATRYCCRHRLAMPARPSTAARSGPGPAAPAAGSMIVGAALLVPASLVIDRPWTLHPSMSSLAALLALSVFSTALAFVIYFRLVRTLGPVGTTAQAYLRVPIGVAIGIVFLGESLTAGAWAGLACVVAGVAAMTMPARERPAGAKPATPTGRA
ncbi:DMT family transporter [Cupriavidus basilensis]